MSDLKREPGTVSSMPAPSSGSVRGLIELDGPNCVRPVSTTALPAAPALNDRTTAGRTSADEVTGAARQAEGKAGTVAGPLNLIAPAVVIAIAGIVAASTDIGCPASMPLVMTARLPLPACVGLDSGLIEGFWRGEAVARASRHCQRRWVARRMGMMFHAPFMQRTGLVDTVKTGAGRD